MSRRARGGDLAILLATALTGLVGAHILDYLVVVPENAHRRTLLHQTGHGYLPLAIVSAAVLAVAAVFATAARGSLRARRGSGSPLAGWVVACRLASLQVSGFLLLEVGERIAAHAPLADVAGPLLGVGVVLQFLVASIAAAVLGLLDRAAAFVTARITRARPRSRPVPPLPRPSARERVIDRLLARRIPVRGPPLFA